MTLIAGYPRNGYAVAGVKMIVGMAVSGFVASFKGVEESSEREGT